MLKMLSDKQRFNMPNPYDDLKSANDAYHEALNEVLKTEEVTVEEKAKIGIYANGIFLSMIEVNKIVKRYFE